MHPEASGHPRHRPVEAPIVLALEGLCCAGKTTLTQALATHRGAVAIAEYAELAALPPWPPRHRQDVILTPDACLYLRVPATLRAARQTCRPALPAHLIDPCAQAGIEAAAACYLDAVPLRRRLVLEGTAPLADLLHAVERLLVHLPPPGEQTMPNWHILAGTELAAPDEERSA